MRPALSQAQMLTKRAARAFTTITLHLETNTVDSPSKTLNRLRQRGGLMNLCTLIGSGLGTIEAASLSQRLAARHDAVLAHEGRPRAGRTDDGCDEDCGHSDARALRAPAVTTFGDCARELFVLRPRARDRAVGLRMSQDRPADTSAWTLTISDRAGVVHSQRWVVDARHRSCASPAVGPQKRNGWVEM
jgi:hypothetical protein